MLHSNLKTAKDAVKYKRTKHQLEDRHQFKSISARDRIMMAAKRDRQRAAGDHQTSSPRKGYNETDPREDSTELERSTVIMKMDLGMIGQGKKKQESPNA